MQLRFCFSCAIRVAIDIVSHAPLHSSSVQKHTMLLSNSTTARSTPIVLWSADCTPSNWERHRSALQLVYWHYVGDHRNFRQYLDICASVLVCRALRCDGSSCDLSSARAGSCPECSPIALCPGANGMLEEASTRRCLEARRYWIPTAPHSLAACDPCYVDPTE